MVRGLLMGGNDPVKSVANFKSNIFIAEHSTVQKYLK